MPDPTQVPKMIPMDINKTTSIIPEAPDYLDLDAALVNCQGCGEDFDEEEIFSVGDELLCEGCAEALESEDDR